VVAAVIETMTEIFDALDVEATAAEGLGDGAGDLRRGTVL